MAAGLGFKEFTTGDVLTAADANGYLASQVVMVFASSAARASAITSPQEGMITYLKDTDSTEYYSGSAYVAIGGASGGTFSAWTPSYTNITVGNGTVVARYTQTGKSVFAYWSFTLGSTSSYGNNARISLPVTAASANFVGQGYGLDAGTVEVIGQTKLHSTTLMNLQVPLNGSYGATQASATFPWTWTTNDQIILCIQYEAA